MFRPKSFQEARQSEETIPAQERNRLWWEQLPMTYAEWPADDIDSRPSVVFQEATRLFNDGWIKENVDFGAYAGQRVLEIGCGAGVATCQFAAAGCDVTAVDITAQAVDLTRRHAALLGLPPFTIQQMDAEELSLETASFDHVFSWGVIHHSSAPERILSHVARVLKPGGTGLVMVYNRASARYWIRGAIELLTGFKFLKGATFDSVQRFYTDGYFHHHFTPRELAAAIERNGLRVTHVDVTHMNKTMLPMMPRRLDDLCKRRWGWLLVARFRKPGPSD